MKANRKTTCNSSRPTRWQYLAPLLLIISICAASLLAAPRVAPGLERAPHNDDLMLVDGSINGSPAGTDDPVLNGGGYTTGTVARFDVVENVTSTIVKRDFQAAPANIHTIATPASWTNDSTSLGVQPYYKLQKVVDPYFTAPLGQEWDPDVDVTGAGTATLSFYPSASSPQYSQINLRYSPSGSTGGTTPGFLKAGTAMWQHDSEIDNTNGHAVIPGKLYQPRALNVENFGSFSSNPGFSTDLNVPYGGVYRPDDQVSLTYEGPSRSLLVNILPATTILGGNPSAAWWHTINIPYEADYVQMKVSWSIDPASNFEVLDQYQVCARVNDEYIDGKPVENGGMMVAKDDMLPLTGSATSLVDYSNPSYLVHGRITRTYNVTSLVNGLKGINKFDFGAWARSPSRLGDQDRILARFHYIELACNTSDKFEVARLDFDYKSTTNLTGNIIVPSSPYLAVNRASLALRVTQEDVGIEETIRLLPFKSMTVFQATDLSQQWLHVSTSISQEHIALLAMNNIDIAIGVLFEKDYYDPTSLTIRLDNITLDINYAYPAIADAQLDYQVDGSGIWNAMMSNLTQVSMDGWNGGQDHTFTFRSRHPLLATLTFINFYSEYHAHLFIFQPSAASATYTMRSANDLVGTWNIRYNNTAPYTTLLSLAATGRFSISLYSFSVLNMPAFDGLGATSMNWRMIAAYTPIGTNFSTSATRFTYGNPAFQSVRLNQALAAGVWNITATQPNYVSNWSFTGASSYLGMPAYYKGTSLNYSFGLIQAVPSGRYAISLVNSTGAILAGYPVHLVSAGQTATGSIPLLPSYPVGQYYIELLWNDTTIMPGQALRFGSLRDTFFILNATTAAFVSTTTSVQSGTTANFTISYKTIESLPITNATIVVMENSTGTYRLWGVSWFGSYLVGTIAYLGQGNYSVPLLTTGAPSGSYHVIFAIGKLYHQPRNLTFTLTVTTTNVLVASISAGATWNVTASTYDIDPGNVPYVNDTINSVVQVYLEQQGTGMPIQDAIVIGRVGMAGLYSTAIEIYQITNLLADRGKYNLTLNTMGLNATGIGQTETLHITCSAGGYDPRSLNVTITIDKMPTFTSLNGIPNINEGGSISLVSTLITLVNPAAPKPHDHGVLTYTILQGTTTVRTGPLSLLMSGVYTGVASMAGLTTGTYTVLVNATAVNCQTSASSNVSFTILPRLATNITLNLPESIRILKPFQLSATLVYLTNGTTISGKIVTLNIVIGAAVNFVVTATTDAAGTVTYDYIVDPRYYNELFTVTAAFAGDERLAPASAMDTKAILDRLPISMAVIGSPPSLRTGYPATYAVQINITDPSESLLNRLIIFIAWYENGNLTPFITQQLRTDSNGIASYNISEIADGKDNMTVIFEYQGSATVAYNFTQVIQPILPRWTSNFTMAALPAIIRYGQAITFSASFTCENASISLVGLPVTFTFLYGINPASTTYIQQGNLLTLAYTIPESIGTSLNVSIVFPGTSRIAGSSQVLALNISPKINVVLEFAEQPSKSYMTGTYIFSVRVTDGGGEPLQGLIIRFDVASTQQLVTTNTEGIASISIDLNTVGNDVVLHVQFNEAGEYEGASLDSAPFRVLDQWLYFLDLLPYIGIACGVILAIAISIHRGVIVPRRNRARASLSKMYQRLSDVENVQYLLVISKAGGVPMFSKSLAEVPIDESLVSGFLSAISSFGAEISTKMKGDLKGGLEELSYQQFKIILHEGQHVRVALLLLRRPSDTLKERLRVFTTEFEKRFHAQVENFKGEVLQDMIVTPVIEQTFESDLLYPHRLIEQKVIPYVRDLPRKSVAKRVLTMTRGGEFESTFYVRELVNHLKTKGIEEILTFDAVQKLKIDQVVFAINPRTNYIIEQLKPYIKMLTADDRAALFAIYENNTDGMSMQKFFNKNKLVLTAELADVLAKLKSMHVIEENNRINSTGAAIVTLLRLIPDL